MLLQPEQFIDPFNIRNSRHYFNLLLPYHMNSFYSRYGTGCCAALSRFVMSPLREQPDDQPV
jgi:hypothetical protein